LNGNEALAKRFHALLEAGVELGLALSSVSRFCGRTAGTTTDAFRVFEAMIKEAAEKGELKFDPVETDVDTVKQLSYIFVLGYVWAFEVGRHFLLSRTEEGNPGERGAR
jgi:hypothetical protein